MSTPARANGENGAFEALFVFKPVIRDPGNEIAQMEMFGEN